jgi:hypothetical protein
MATEAASPFAFFVVSVPPNDDGENGHVVPRFGLREVYIGVRRPSFEQSDEETRLRALRGKPKGPSGWIWSEEPDGITHREYAAFRREYDNAIRDGSLTKLSVDEGLAKVKTIQAESAKRREADAKKAADLKAKSEAAPAKESSR